MAVPFFNDAIKLLPLLSSRGLRRTKLVCRYLINFEDVKKKNIFDDGFYLEVFLRETSRAVLNRTAKHERENISVRK